MLQSTLFPELNATVVFDPEERVSKNLDGDLIFIQSVDELKMVAKTASQVLLVYFGLDVDTELLGQFGGIISNEKVRKLDMEHISLHYFEGNFDTIRFAFPGSLKKPHFYRVKGEKFEYPVYKVIADDIFMSMGLHGLVANRKLHIHFRKHNKLLNGGHFFLHCENYVFNRLATIFDFNGENERVVKVSDSELAREMIDREAKVLQSYEPMLKGRKLHLPKVLDYNSSLVLSNNYPNGLVMSDQLEDLHLQALTELYEVNVGVKKVSALLSENNYLNTIKAFKLILSEGLHPNGISGQHVEEICIDIITLINRINVNEPVYTSLYHGAFSPENCLKKDDILYLNNFGKSENDKPLLFDAFYYLFHYLERENMPKMGEMDDIMKSLFKNKQLMKIIERYEINFKLNLALFHVHYIIRQIESFLKQRFINPNVNFVLTFYREALERMNSVSI